MNNFENNPKLRQSSVYTSKFFSQSELEMKAMAVDIDTILKEG